MTDASNTEVLIEKSLARLTAECETLEHEIQSEAEKALEDWLLVEACKDYDTIELDGEIMSKAHRKKFKALRALLETTPTPEGEKLRKKFAAEREKYQL